jgi:hypothetical protein
MMFAQCLLIRVEATKLHSIYCEINSVHVGAPLYTIKESRSPCLENSNKGSKQEICDVGAPMAVDG